MGRPWDIQRTSLTGSRKRVPDSASRCVLSASNIQVVSASRPLGGRTTTHTATLRNGTHSSRGRPGADPRSPEPALVAVVK